MKNKIFLFLIALNLILGFKQTAQAETNLDLLPPELRGEINKSLGNSLNALVIFSSSSSLGSGKFGFRDHEGPDPELEVMRLIGEYNFGDPETDSGVPYIRGGLGRTKLKEVIPDDSELGGAADFSTITTWSFIVGTGYDFQLIEDLHLVPYFDFVYSYTDNEYDFNNEFSQEILALFDRDIFNWHIHTFSYNPGAMLYYNARYGRTVITPSLNYTHIFLDSRSTNSELLKIDASSYVLQSKIKAEIPVTEGTGRAGVYAVPSFSRTDIYRDARDGLGLGYYHEVGMAVLAKEQTLLPLLKDVGLSAGYAFADDMWGWRVGLEGAF